jgi:hypothetical protein
MLIDKTKLKAVLPNLISFHKDCSILCQNIGSISASIETHINGEYSAYNDCFKKTSLFLIANKLIQLKMIQSAALSLIRILDAPNTYSFVESDKLFSYSLKECFSELGKLYTIKPRFIAFHELVKKELTTVLDIYSADLYLDTPPELIKHYRKEFLEKSEQILFLFEYLNELNFFLMGSMTMYECDNLPD